MSEREEMIAILQKAHAFWETRILLTAAELNIFSPLLDKPKTAAQVAKELSSNGRGTEALLNALTAIGLLVKEKGKFRVKPGFERFLSSSSSETVLPLILHMADLWKSWSNLTDIVLKGKESGKRRQRDEASLTAFIGAMHTIGGLMAPGVVSKLDLASHKNFIDVGGGSGVYTIAVLKAAPHIRATIFDLPPVIELARQKVAEENLTGRVKFVKGDFYRDALPDGHDLALVSAIIHQNSPQQNVELFRKIFDALVPGGTIVIRDYVMTDDHTQPAQGAFFAINMFVNTPGGGTYSFEEIKEALEKAGFKNAKLLQEGEMDGLVSAERPKGKR